MKPPKKYYKKLSLILFNEFESNKNTYKDKEIHEPIKNSELYKNNILIKRDRIIFFYKMKYSLKKKIYSPFLDTTNNYNKMIISNILSNKISNIKTKYTEMLYDIESNDVITKFIQKKEVYYFLKYLVVVYDKFHVQFPNYLKDVNVYYFMSKYLLAKQKYFDRIKETNEHNYIQKRLNKLLERTYIREKKFFSSKISHSDSEEENLTKLKQIRGKCGFDVDVENSEDSLDQLKSLVGKIEDNFDIPQTKDIYLRSRSKSFKNLDTILLNYPNIHKTKKVRWSSLLEINNKKLMRNKKRKGTEVKFLRKKVVIDKVVDKDKIKKKIKRKATKEQMKQNLINKKNEINEIKRLILLNDVGKNNKILDVVKRGFVFINDNDKNTIINNRNILKTQKNHQINNQEKKETNKVIIIKEKIKKLIENKNNYDLFNRDNYNLFKNGKSIIKNLNHCLNEYRFYNKSKNNSTGKQKYYERKVIPGLFNNKVNTLFISKNENNNKIKNLPSIGTITPVRKKYCITSGTYCKKYSKLNNILFDNKIRITHSNKKENNYYIDSILTDKDDKNSKYFNNILERQENSIYKYYKTSIRDKKAPLVYKLNHFKNFNLTEGNNIKNNMNINNNFLINHTEYNNYINKKKIESYMKSNREKLLFFSIYNNKNLNNIGNTNNNNNDENYFNNDKNKIKIKLENNQTLSVHNSHNKFDNNFKNKIKIKLSDSLKRKK